MPLAASVTMLDRISARRAQSVAPLLGAADALRSWILRHRVCAPFIRSRDRRVVALALFACATALAASVGAPGYMLLVGPVVLGVPHLFFEARYLFFQHAQLRRAALVAILAAQAMLVFAGVGIYTLGFACMAALLVTGKLHERRALAIFGLAMLAQTAALIGPTWSRFVLLHAHNCIPIVVWMLWRRRPAKISIVVVACVAAAAASIMIGCFDDLPLRPPFGDHVFSITKITDAVAGGFGGEWRRRFLLFFCFTQALHYAVWIRLMPEEARTRETPRSWRASWRAFKADSGPHVARLMVLASIAVPVVAVIGGVVRMRALYVTVSEFHATVEVILIAVVFARAQLPRYVENANGLSSSGT